MTGTAQLERIATGVEARKTVKDMLRGKLEESSRKEARAKYMHRHNGSLNTPPGFHSWAVQAERFDAECGVLVALGAQLGFGRKKLQQFRKMHYSTEMKRLEAEAERDRELTETVKDRRPPRRRRENRG